MNTTMILIRFSRSFIIWWNLWVMNIYIRRTSSYEAQGLRTGDLIWECIIWNKYANFFISFFYFFPVACTEIFLMPHVMVESLVIYFHLNIIPPWSRTQRDSANFTQFYFPGGCTRLSISTAISDVLSGPIISLNKVWCHRRTDKRWCDAV